MTTRGLGALVVAAATALAGACNKSTDPPVSFLVGLRVLAIQAEPPQVDPGAVPVDGHGESRPALRAATGDCLLLARVREHEHGGTRAGHDRGQPVGPEPTDQGE